MALQESNAIAQAFQNAFATILANKERQRSLDIEQQRASAATEAEKARIEQEKESLKQRQHEFDVTSKAAQALHNMQIMSEEQKIATGAAQTGIMPPGVGSSPIPVGGSVNLPGIGQIPIPPQVAAGNTVSFPSGHTIDIPTPQVFAQQQADIARITNKPAEEAKTREQAAVQAAETERQLKVGQQGFQQRLQEIDKQNQYENQRQANMISAQAAIHNSENAAALQRAMITSSGGLFGMPGQFNSGVHIVTSDDGEPQVIHQNPADYITNTIGRLENGTLSSDELKKTDSKGAPTILRLASQRGIVPLTKDQQTNLKDLEEVSKAVPLLKEMAEIRASSGTSFVPGTDAYKLFEADKDKLGKYTANITRVLGNIRRLNTQDVELTLNSMIPSRAPWKGATTGIDKYNEFVTSLQNDFNTATNTLPKNQQDLIRQRLGYNSFPYLNKLTSAPGQQVGTPQGMTPPGGKKANDVHWVLQNGKLVPVAGGGGQ